MDIIKAREIVRTLADGVDPTTGEVLPKENVYNSPDIIRALYCILEATTPAQERPTDPLRNAGKPWTGIEDEKLRDEFLSKVRISDIAKEHGRTYKAIDRRLEHLGLKRKPFWLFTRKQN